MTKRRNLRRRASSSPSTSSRGLNHETLEKRELLAAGIGPRLISVATNAGAQFDLAGNNPLFESPREITFRFDGGQQINPATLSAFRFTASGGDGSFAEGNEVAITPGFIGLGESPQIVIARFASDLPDDQYKISISGFDDTSSGLVALRNVDGDIFQPTTTASVSAPSQDILLNIEVGPRVVAVVPQPIDYATSPRSQLRDTIHVYFNDDPLGNRTIASITTTGSLSDPSVVNPVFYKLYFTNDTVETGDDIVHQPMTVTYESALNRATLKFDMDLADFAGANGAGTFRLRVGSSQSLPQTLPPNMADLTTDAGDTFTGAQNLGVAFGSSGDQSITINGNVQSPIGNTIRWPGLDAPGVRDDRRDPQVTGRADTNDGIDVYFYNFADLYGTDAADLPLENAITPAQRQRAREILSLYSQSLGVQFIETEDQGLQIVTGDLRALVETATTGPGLPFQEFRVNDQDPSKGVLVLDAGENWFDGYGLSPDARPSWFVEALRGVGSLLGIGNTFDLVPGVASGSFGPLYDATTFPVTGTAPDFSIEPDFLSTSDIIPGQALHRPEIKDADLYRFTVTKTGRISIESFAERLLDTSLLDTELKLWKLNVTTGKFDIVARNADFYGNDSFIGVDVTPDSGGAAATYILGVTAKGNSDYNPDIAGSGGGGLSQGRYDVRISFESTEVNTIVDTNKSRLDGDSDGQQGGDFNFWFRVAKTKTAALANEPRTLFVQARDGFNAVANGTVTAPFQTIQFALAQARPGDIVRLLPNGGADNRIDTTFDNRAYEIGTASSGAILADGKTLEVPKGVTVMIDAGSILKLSNAKISVGSETVDQDRSLAALQVLGAPVIIDQNGVAIDGTVDITSYREERRAGVLLGLDTNPQATTPTPGDWAGIEFRNDFDYSEGRAVWETEGIFLDYVSHADIRYGGGSVQLTDPSVTPLQMLEARPTLIYNQISFAREAAVSADPNSFAETNFAAPLYQQASLARFGTTFASDYDRVGPFIRGNTLVNNSINGLFVRVLTPAVGQREPQTVSGRFDDLDIVHTLSEVLVLQGEPGGPLLLESRPDVVAVNVTPTPGTNVGTLNSGDTLDYRITFVTTDGFESLSSAATRTVNVTTSRAVTLTNLPAAPSQFAGRRLYRLTPTGDYVLVASLDRATGSYTDNGSSRGGLLSSVALATATNTRLLPRTNARLSVDPGLVVKLDSARIEATFGADFYAEGVDGKPVVFTSRLDDRFGAGGTFDTNNDGAAGTPTPGDWSGLVFRQGSSASIDYATIAYAGGDSATSGNLAFFNPVEILQADVRVAHSTFSNNASGSNGSFDIRDGIGFNGSATIFVRGAQPVLVDNTIFDNQGVAISINPDALNYLSVRDHGRGTGVIDLFMTDGDNQGPLITANKLDNNAINGLFIRNEVLTTESVWDDTDIVHVVQESVQTWNYHQRGGLRLKSDPNQSLVVKLQNNGSLRANKLRTDVVDAIGGTLQIIGQPGFPVILTSLSDDSVGAGFTPSGLPQTNTDNANNPATVDWYGLVIQPGSNDRNVAFIPEAERAVGTSSGINAIPSNAQILGLLAKDEKSSDENRRLGFNVRGSLSTNGDIDVYTFRANGGTEVYLDIDDTDFGLDTVVELIDVNGNILALSNSSVSESVTPTGPNGLVNNIGTNRVLPLFKTGETVVENPNSLDAGMRVILPGNSANPDNVYYVRVRSSNLRPGDFASRLTTTSLVGAGLSSGQYQLSIRLRETDEVAGSTIRLADIRYAFNAIDVPSAPSHSPLAAEHAEELTESGLDLNDSGAAFNAGEGTNSFANGVADPLGALSASDRGALRVSGALGNNVLPSDANFALFSEQDLDVYRVDLFANLQEPDIIGENRFVSTTFDIDYADQLGRANTSIAVYTAGGQLILHSRDSNIADDQGRPTEGNDVTNLNAGSSGTLDAYIGPVELQQGTYYVVVSSAQMIPSTLNQLFLNNPVGTDVRILPIDSVRRIGEEGFDSVSLGVNSSFASVDTVILNTAAELPTVAPLFDATSLVPYKLEDVRLFLTLDGGLSGNNNTTVISLDPFTGQLERTIGQFGQPVGDLAIRRDGELFAYSLGPANGNQTNGNTGNFLNISSVNAAANGAGDDGLDLRTNNQNNNGVAVDANLQFLVNALAFLPSTNTSAIPSNNPTIPGGERAFVVGNREDADNPFGNTEVPFALRRNILYSVEANTGAATNNNGNANANADRNYPANTPFNDSFGAGANKDELGIVDTGQFPDSPADPTGALVDGGTITGIAMDPTQRANFVYAVTDQGYVYTFNPLSTRSVDVDADPTNSYSDVINATNRGLVPPDPDDFTSTFNGFVEFTSLTLGPRITERVGTAGLGPYAQVLFATTADGWLYTMRIDPVTNAIVPAYVLYDGNYAIELRDTFGSPLNVSPTGLAFSIREENLFHQTADRGASFDEDHGIFVAHNQSRIRTVGGSSLYFGVEVDGNAANNSIDGGTVANGTLNPGGAHGSVVSRPVDLQNYNIGDKPTLYFTYFLETEDGRDYDPPSNGINNQQVDSFRVFAAGDDGQWRLMTTNSTYRSFSNVPTSDEYDYVALNGGSPIQEAFDNTNQWRQARVDLSPLAGNKNVQIRFDFSTAGGMHSQFVSTGYLTEIQAPAGTDIVSGTGFSLFNSVDFGFEQFEFVRGAAVNVPDPTTIVDGQLVRFTSATGVNTTLRLTTGAAIAPTDINIAPTDLASDIARNIALRLQTLAPTLLATAVGNRVTAPEANSFTLTPAGFGAPTAVQDLPSGAVPIYYNNSMTSQQVRNAIRQGLANGIGNVDLTTGITTATIANYPEYGTNRIRLYNQFVGGNTATSVGFSQFLPGDEFGAASSDSISTARINTRPASNNNVEGVYLDDIVIGFAERGEAVYNSPVNRNFSVLPEQRTFTFNDTQVPEFPNEILVGAYTLEIRTSSDYGVPEDYDPIRLELNEQFGLGRSFETNDRLADGVTLIAPSGVDLIDGDTFVISNGTSSVTFEFDSNNNVTTGRVPVAFTAVGVGAAFSPDSDQRNVIARNIRDAVNSPAARNVLGIRAGGSDGSDAGPMTGDRVELFGSSIQVNPSSGRFLKVDLVDEETFYGRESARSLPIVDHDGQSVIEDFFYDTFARATVTDYVNGRTDTLVAVGKIGDHVATFDANVLILDSPFNDVDIVKIYLNRLDSIDVDLDTIGWSKGVPFTNPSLQIYRDVNGIPTLVPTTQVLRSPGEANNGGSINGFIAPVAGYYYVRIAAASTGYGEYQLTIRPSGFVTRDVVMADYHFDFGDENRFRDQGQLIIESNFIRSFGNIGIRATADPAGLNVDDDANFSSTPLDRRAGAAATLRNPNTDRLLPGTVITNNVIIADPATAGRNGVVFSGEIAPGGDSPAPVPFGRIINNTIVGVGTGNGVTISGGAAPTVFNNIVTRFTTGLNIAANSNATVEGGNAFQANTTNTTVPISGTDFVIPVGVRLFQDAANGIYIPASGSAVIDSSFASLNDRSNFVNTVKQPVGIASSPIIAPAFDAYGIPRFDDPTVATPGGVGSNVFIDRGAIDRADFVRPKASLISPLDFVSTAGGSVAGGDIDPSESFVRLTQGSVEFFEIQLTDPSGSGPDARTITQESVLLTENGQRLVPGVDYTFGYSDNSRLIRLTPLAGLFRQDAVYEITLNNQTRIAYQAPSGSEIVDGDQVIVADAAGNRSVFEFESGYAVTVPQTSLLTVNGANNAFADRETFVVTAPSGNSLTFEFNLVGSTTGGRVPVELSTASTLTQVRDAILASFNLPAPGGAGQTVSQFLNLSPVAVGGDRIQLGTLTGHVVSSTSTGLSVSGQAGGIADGQTFIYASGTQAVTFEFDSNGSLGTSTNVAINFTRQSTPAQIGQAIVNAVRSQPLGLDAAVALPTGTAVLGGRVGDVIDVTTSSLAQSGQPGVTGPLSLTVPPAQTGASIDNRTFTVTSGGSTQTFRYTTNPALVSPDRLVVLNPTDLVNGIATKSAAAIAASFPGELMATSSGATIFIGEPSSSVSGATTSVTAGTAGLIPGGISGGAIRVNYLPTSPRTSIAATLQGAIEAAPVNVSTFEAGGGTILIAGAASLQGRRNGGAITTIGVLTPAITDLAGNPVAETRTNDETRFTIIMPDVVFDFGDAPNTYSTLVANNGARHTIGPQGLPRLGDFIDSEDDGQPVDQDDTPLLVSIAPGSVGGQPVIFTVDSLSIPDTVLTVVTAMPLGGETLTITVDGTAYTFELLELNANPTGSNIGVTFSTTDSIADVTTNLVAAIRAAVPQTDDGLLIAKNAAESFTINAIDDEDGVLQGQLIANGTTYSVFTQRGTDPTNVRPEDALGFLNPLDPAGTNIDVKVFGAGLLHVWIDFDQSGTFESDEQVLANFPVSGDDVTGSFNTITVFTPSDALDGDTWMRVRISESGNLLPTGVAIGGEVEDYQVQVISVALPIPDDDSYGIVEDQRLDTVAQGLTSVSNGDMIPPAPPRFLPVQYIAGELPKNGTLVSLNATNGHFVYQPNPDFSGVDTFTYRLSTQPNESATAISLTSFATVTISVAPVNDAPAGSDRAFTSLEDLPQTITANQLLVGAIPDADPRYTPPVGGSGNPTNDSFLNEANQLASLRVVGVQGSGSTLINAGNAASTPGSVVFTTAGSALSLRVTSPTAGDVFSLAFGGITATFELVPVGGVAQAGTTPVQLVVGETTALIATRLATAIQARFASGTPTLSAIATSDSIGLSSTPPTVAASSNAPAVFTITSSTGGQIIDLISVPTPTAAPTTAVPNPPIGNTVTLTVAGQSKTFEFVATGATASTGNIPVRILNFANPTSTAARASAAASLAVAIDADLRTRGVAVGAGVRNGATSPDRVEISATTVTAGKSFTTARGTAIPLFDQFGSLIELRYLSGQDLNRNNPPPAVPTLLDRFTFVVRDNGVAIDLVNNRFVYGTGLSALPATATIDVAPQNDPPRLVADLISVGPLGPAAGTVTTAWETFGGATPTEDQVLMINPAFLLLNDSRGPVTAADENAPNSQNDTGLTVTAVVMVDGTQGTIALVGGQIVFTPAPNIFGDVIFTYSARDQGINEDLTGTRPLVPLTSINGTVTISIQPVNDIPVAFDRALTFTESANPGVSPAFSFTRDQLILGSTGETPAAPGTFPPTLAAPFNESEQTPGLRVVAFTTSAGTIDVSTLTGVGAQQLTLASDAGGVFEFDFVNGIFTTGRLISPPDFNGRTPFAANEKFTYVIADNGLTTNPQGGGQFNLPSVRSDADPASRATVTIVVNPANDAPTFTIPASNINVLERDDNVGTVVANFATDILPGSVTARDENENSRQNVVFTFPAALNTSTTVPTGLFTRLPILSPTGQLTVFPSPDAIGSAVFVVQAEDAEPGTVGFVPRTTLATFTINVRPVNDAPRFNNNLSPRSDMRDADDAYTVANVDNNGDGQIDDATIRYTLREDNTQAMGVVQDYFIPLRRVPAVGYSRVGLLDVFTVGPANEAGAFEGGSQTLSFLNAGNTPPGGTLDRTTDRGGILTPVFNASGVQIGLNYRPPTDFNSSFAGVDSFSYTVIDDNPAGGETFDLTASALVPMRLTSTNRVELFLTPVNDRPEFTAATLNISVQEDSQAIRFDSYASNISAGPSTTAFDEVDVNTGQLVEFTVTSLDFPREDADDFFSTYPTINEQTGQLSFRPAANVFGVFRFEVVLSDQNRDGSLSNNTTRGDLISSVPVTLTITVNPVNDPPVINPAAAPLAFTLLEDGLFEILVEGDNTNRGLLDVFFPGPNVGATNEAANIAPRPGGNQTISLGSPVPTSSAQGGSLQLVTTAGVSRFLYRPRPNFVGADSFIYTVIDNGVTVDIGGVTQNDPRIASNIVTFNVLPVNDEPQFSGAPDVNSDEDEGPVTISNWATNVLAGPPTATDEIDGQGATPPQGLRFILTQTSANTNLFVTPPRVVFNTTTNTWDLQYETRENLNGVATFSVVLEDLGPRDLGNGDVFATTPPRTFSINVAAVNDPPTFSLVSSSIPRLEDSGPFSTLQATNISPGPADESSQTVTFEIETLAPEFSALFSELPTINPDGVLRFTPAPNRNTSNANGPVPVRVIARDSLGAVTAAMTFQIVITEVNDAPRAVPDAFTSNEDTVFTITTAQLQANDIDPDLQTNASEIVRLVMPTDSLSVSGARVNYNAATRVVTYDPTDAVALQSLAPGQTLVDSFAYSLIDEAGLNSNLTTVAITVTGINDKPTVVMDSPTLNPDGTTLIRILDNDSDIDGTININSLQITLQPAFGSLAIQPDGSVIYTPFSSFAEEDIFRYTVADNLGLRSDEATVTISANASPIARPDTRGTFLDEAIIINVAANDTDPDGTLDLTSITIATAPRRGQAVPLANGTIQYLPNVGFIGTDSFTYQIRDNQGRPSNIATVTVQVVASRLQNPDEFNDVNGDGFVTSIDALLIINRLARDTDGDGRIPVTETDRGPFFYDVSGDRVITSLDALRVINQLSRINNRVSQERVDEVTSQSVVGFDVLRNVSTPMESHRDREFAEDVVEEPSETIGKLVATSLPNDDSFADDVIDLLVDDRSEIDRDESMAAIDEVLAGLM